MNAKLVKSGGQYVIQLDAELVESVGLREGDQLQVDAAGEAISIRPADGDADARRRFRRALDETNKRYGNMLRRLAE